MALLNLFDPETGMPVALLDATAITEMRTGAVTALGAKYLARKDSRVLGHIGARGTAYWNVRLLNHLFPLDEIRVHSRRPESREPFAARLSQDLGRAVRAVESWQDCLEGADIQVEASRLEAPTPHFKTAWVKPGNFVVPYGTMSAVELSLTDAMDKLVVDDWGQCKGGKLGALRAHVEAGKLSEATLHGELGEIVTGKKPGRERADETILFWHRGLSLSDIALGAALLEQAAARGGARAWRERGRGGGWRGGWSGCGPGRSRAAGGPTRPACSGTAASRCRTSRWAPPCWRRPPRRGWGSRCAMRDAAAFPVCVLRDARPGLAPGRAPQDEVDF